MTNRLLAPALLILGLLLTGCGNEGTNGARDAASDAESSSAPSPTDESSTAAAAGACTYTADGSTPPTPVDPPPGDPTTTGTVSVGLETSAGDINLDLNADATPCTVNSFLSLADQGYFDDTVCHRITTEGIWVLQCGDPTGTGAGGPGYAFADELTGNETYPAGTLAMANAGPGTNGSQFFLVYEDSLGLPPNYTVFGTVSPEGIKVLQEIAKKGTADGGTDGAPRDPVTIQSVTVA